MKTLACALRTSKEIEKGKEENVCMAMCNSIRATRVAHISLGYADEVKVHNPFFSPF